jgi:RND family efflux transporter MFP subunit
MNSYSKITAPFAGVVTKRYADTGAMIPAGTASTSNGLPVVQISQNTLLRLILPVPEAIVAGIRLGQTVDVRVGALKRTFQGKVSRFVNDVNRSTRTMDTQVDVPNPNLTLIPGMYAEAILTLDKRENAIAIPLEGVSMLSKSATAYVVNAAGEVEIRPLKLGMETPDRVEVLSGLKEGDLVVIGNRSQLAAGQLVQPKVAEAVQRSKHE